MIYGRAPAMESVQHVVGKTSNQLIGWTFRRASPLPTVTAVILPHRRFGEGRAIGGGCDVACEFGGTARWRRVVT